MTRFRTAFAVATAAAWVTATAWAQQPQHAHPHDHDAHHRDMLTRGAGAMGFDQERTVHHFLLDPDGGAIEVTVKEASDLHQQSASGHMMKGRGPGMMGGGHDPATMAEMGDIHELFINHDRITRTVTNLPNGIRTVTESADPRIAQLLTDHVTSMGQRVETGKDPGLPIESQALRSIYRNYDKIYTTFEPTATGIIVIQTSTDPNTVAALLQHASEVRDFVNEGMAAMHQAMMRNGGGMMHRGMMGSMPKDNTTPNPR
jgi:hypothetical protein